MVSFDRHASPEYKIADYGIDLVLYASSYAEDLNATDVKKNR